MTTLVTVSPHEIELLWRMQREAFLPLLQKYRDYGTSPADVTLDELKHKLSRPEVCGCWFILEDGERVG